ncbi:hypothetical protein RCL1_006535 [Eukaryota sp. TZLM3-RCL]
MAHRLICRLPCSIDYSGPIDTSRFNVTEDGTHYEASFRGRKLLGEKLPLPPSYSVVAVDSEQNITSPAAELVVFAHDKPPIPPNLLQYISIMNCLG